MPEMTDATVGRSLARIMASDRDEEAARVTASVLETLAGDLTRWRGSDRRIFSTALATYRPDVTIPPPAEHFDGGDPLFREFVAEVERLARELIAKLTGTGEDEDG